jgi:hypothetical protein
MNVMSAMFGMIAMQTALDWIFSGYPSRLPDLKICLSEGGIGWIMGLFDRLSHAEEKLNGCLTAPWASWDVKPSEVLQRNFYFCFLTDPHSLKLRHEIGIEHIMFETDYPHSDSSWPNSQQHLHRQVRDLPLGEIEHLTWRNAAGLFRHPIPEHVQRDPGSF